MVYEPDFGDYDDANSDKAKIEDDQSVPCRICWDVFGRIRLTVRYCATCHRGFCEGEHGNFSGGQRGVCVRCFSRKDMQSRP